MKRALFYGIVFFGIALLASISSGTFAYTTEWDEDAIVDGGEVTVTLYAQPANDDTNAVLVDLDVKGATVKSFDVIEGSGWFITADCENGEAFTDNQLCATIGRTTPIELNEVIGEVVFTIISADEWDLVKGTNSAYSDGKIEYPDKIPAHETFSSMTDEEYSQMLIEADRAQQEEEMRQEKSIEEEDVNEVLAIVGLATLIGVFLVMSGVVVVKMRNPETSAKAMMKLAVPLIVIVISAGFGYVVMTFLQADRAPDDSSASTTDFVADGKMLPIYSDARLKGYARNPFDKNDRAMVHFLVDEKFPTKNKIDFSKAALLPYDNRIGTRENIDGHMFDMMLPDEYMDGKKHTIHAFTEGERHGKKLFLPLENSPQVYDPATAQRPPDDNWALITGYFSGIKEDGTAWGRANKSSISAKRAEVHFYADGLRDGGGTFIGQIKANLENVTGKGPAASGFEFKIDPKWDGSKIYAYRYYTNEVPKFFLLFGSPVVYNAPGTEPPVIEEQEIVCGPLDVIDDNKLNIVDFAAFVKVYNKTCTDTASTTGCGGKDTNGDAKINLIDFKYFVDFYLAESCLLETVGDADDSSIEYTN